MAIAEVMESDHLVGVLMRTCWAHEEVVSWTQLWGVCKQWCDVWLENDQAWVTYFLNRQNSRISWGLQREQEKDAEIARLRVQLFTLAIVDHLRLEVATLKRKNDKQKVQLDETKVYLQDANKTVFELQAKDRLRAIEDSRVVRERWLKPGRPALVGGDQ